MLTVSCSSALKEKMVFMPGVMFDEEMEIVELPRRSCGPRTEKLFCVRSREERMYPRTTSISSFEATSYIQRWMYRGPAHEVFKPGFSNACKQIHHEAWPSILLSE
jgi:hypothetical protein